MEIIERVGGIENHHEIDFLLPNDLVTEILLRLPVESLLRFKTVCKYWYDVINGCDFVDNHFDHHTNHSRLLVYHDIPYPIQYFGVGEPTEALSIFPDETLAGEHPSHHYLDYPCMPNRAKEVIGPVKGLFLLRLFEDELLQGCTAVLLNPAIREFRPLVVPYSDWDSYHSYLFQMFGFGFDPLNRDFKVVSLWCWDESRISIPTSGRPRVVVYSLANDSWKYLDLDLELEHDPLNKRNRKKVRSSGTIHINGTCYWMLQECKLEIFYLLSFDLTSDVLREIKVPEYDSFTVRHPKLVLYNDSVAMFFYHPYIWSGVLYSENIDLMVMNKEGCWTRDLTVDVSHLQMEWSPLGFWKNKSFFFQAGDDMQLVLFDHSTHEIKELGIHKRYFDSCPFVYKESLVSLKGGTLQHEDIFSFRINSLIGRRREQGSE